MRVPVTWITLLLLFANYLSAEQASALALQQRIVEVFENNRDAVVRVRAGFPEEGLSEDGKRKVTLRVGTGFFISKEGHVLVSASRAAGAERVLVEHRGKLYATESIGHDRLTNISILRTLEIPEEFSIINIDTTVERPQLGSIAVAISCPLDFEPSPAMGIFTGLDKRIGDKFFPTEYIRTSIAVDAGQGGCPILDINGRFVGMSVASIPDLRASYCLPADALARVRDDLLFSGKVIHAWLGFEVTVRLRGDNTNEVVLSKVIEDAPAARAGLQKGDRVISIGGREIREVSDVPGAIFFIRSNQFTTVKVIRGEKEMEFSVKALPKPEPDATIGPKEATDRSEPAANESPDSEEVTAEAPD